jgi:hypothetical protein
MVAWHDEQPVALQAAQLRPEVIEPFAGQRVLLGDACERNIAGDRHQVGHKPFADFLLDEAADRAQHRVGIPGPILFEVDVGQMQDANELILPRDLLPQPYSTGWGKGNHCHRIGRLTPASARGLQRCRRRQ